MKNFFRRVGEKLRYLYFDRFFPEYLHLKTPKAEDYNNKILSGDETNRFLASKIEDNNPFLAARFGSSELNCVRYYTFVIKNGGPNYNSFFAKTPRETVCNLSGFFPPKDKLLKKFSELYFEDIPKIDLLGIWYNSYEDIICNTYCKNTSVGELAGLEPYYYKSPWSKKLKGKKVLVIHPFAKTIESQYRNNREKLFDDRDILPEFELITLKAVQSIAGQHTEFKTWFEALDYMKDRIKNIDFDVALIGAGAYSISLGAFIKEMGKQAVHLGGALQILFGIKGARWEAMPEISKFFNEYWVRPAEDERPKAANTVEGGCYW